MSVLSDTWRQLVRRRLLPVAILLVAALVALPFVLAKEPAPVAAPQAAKPSTAPVATAATGDPIVTLVQDGERTKRRRVLGARKNPFEPAPVKAARPSSATVRTVTQKPAQSSDDTGGKPATPGPITVGPALPPAPPVVQTPQTPKKTYELYSLTVRFGNATSETLERMNLGRLKALPSVEEPVLVYLGVSDDKKTAVFMVDSNVLAQGDGSCKPHPSNCETIHLQEGETEFFDVVDEDGNVMAQYQLDLIDIKQRKTASAAEARKARVKASAAGRVLLRARTSADGPLRYRYDAKTGTVKRLAAKAYKAAAAKFVKAAAAVE